MHLARTELCASAAGQHDDEPPLVVDAVGVAAQLGAPRDLPPPQRVAGAERRERRRGPEPERLVERAQNVAQ